MADSNDQALDAALQAGASIEDINSIRGRYSLALLEPATTEAPQEQTQELVSPTAEVFQETPAEVDTSPSVWIEEAPAVVDTNRRNYDALNEAARASALGQDPTAYFQEVQNSPTYDPEARAEMFLRNTGAALEQVQGDLESRVAAGGKVEDVLKEKGLTSLVNYSGLAMQEARSYVASVPTTANLNEKDKEDLAFMKYLDFITAKVSDEIGWNRATVADAAAFLIPQENLRYNQVADKLGLDYEAMDFIDYTDFLNRTSAYIRSEAPERRQELVETLLTAWPEIKGNNRLALVDFLQTIQQGAGDFSRLESGLERLDQALLGFSLGKIITGGLKTLNIINTASRMKNIEAVSDAVTAGAQGALGNVGVTPIDALASLDPMQAAPALVKGANNTYATEVGLIQRDVDIYLEAASKVNSYGLNLTEPEKVAARDRAVSNLEANGSISNVRVDPVDETTFKLSFDYQREGEEFAVKGTTTHNYTRDDIRTGFVSLDGKGHNPFNLKVTSPNFRFQSDRDLLVQAPEQLQFMGKKIQGLYDGAIKSALKPLSRSEMKGVDFVLTKGDEWVDDLGNNSGRYFTRDEAVVEGIEGVKLTDKQYQAYKDVRKVVDYLHVAKNKEIIDVWKAKGIKVMDWKGERAPVKTYDTPQAALQGFRGASSRSHWIGMEDDTVRALNNGQELTEELVEEMYATGHKLVRTAENKFIPAAGTNLEWAFVKGEKVRDPSGIVLNYRQGYMPKIKEDAFYFVKEVHDVTIGGKTYEKGALKTVRYFDSFSEADKFAKKMNANDPNRYRVLADREMSASQVDSELINISGGLFTGKRSEGVPFGPQGAVGQRADSLEGLQRYIRNIARNTPMSLYREGIQQRWLQHAKESGALSKAYIGSFEEAVDGRHLDLDNSTAPFLVDSHRQISFLSGIRTNEEKLMLSAQRELAKRLENIPGIGKPLSRRLLNGSTEGITGTIKGLTYHLMLGMYSPAQFFIQASGSLISLSINPIHGLKAIAQLPGYAIADLFLGNPAQKAKMIEVMRAKGIDMDGYEVWDQAGVREAITTSNLDYHSLWSDKPYDAGLIGKLVANSSLFVNSGELVSARVAFATSYNKWRSELVTDVNRKPNTQDVKDILSRMEVYRLNMTRPNSAYFQKGLLSIPTQFQQVNTKFFEKLLGRGELTKTEKFRLIAAQSVIFGAAGVPLAKSMLPGIIDYFNTFREEKDQINAINTSPEVLNALQNGIMAWLLQDYFDVENVITGRMALGQDFVENVFGLATEQTSLADIALGPFKSIFDSATSGFSRFATAVSTVMYGEDAEPQDFAAVTSILGKSVLEMSASTRNAMKAYDMTHSEFFRNKAGRPIAEWGDLNTQTIVAQGLGFAAQEVADYHELNAREGGVIPQKFFRSDSDRIVRLLVDLDGETNADQLRWHGMALNTIMTKYKRPEDRVEMIAEIKKKLDEPANSWGKLMNKVMLNWQSELQNGLGEIHKQASLKISPAVARQLSKTGMNTAGSEEPTSEE